MTASDNENTPPRISINLDDIKGHEGDSSPGGGTPKSSTGWDGKLRLEKKLELVNPEALSDPEYSDDEQVLAGETIEADEGRIFCLLVLQMAGFL
jgi:protein phosphatase 1 regulatory subunit 7